MQLAGILCRASGQPTKKDEGQTGLREVFFPPHHPVAITRGLLMNFAGAIIYYQADKFDTNQILLRLK